MILILLMYHWEVFHSTYISLLGFKLWCIVEQRAGDTIGFYTHIFILSTEYTCKPGVWGRFCCVFCTVRFPISFRVTSPALVHDDVMPWKRFPRYRPFVRGIHRSRVDSRSKAPIMRALIFYVSPNKRLNELSSWWWFVTLWRPLWRHCNEIPLIHQDPQYD